MNYIKFFSLLVIFLISCSMHSKAQPLNESSVFGSDLGPRGWPYGRGFGGPGWRQALGLRRPGCPFLAQA
ncbi:hypothetical protein BpHYR1_015949 [Brachionus plicatilis]|uniref:Uncharacterized protein n=1 Tax=Brachionus plicatilis TaxID=10195 RepID=A0A3M7QFX4_BRAPC|nr:hypothetical protein BpHYR1_015949 [Brachionus plicatilis]